MRLSKEVKDKKKAMGKDSEEVFLARLQLGGAHFQRGRVKESERCFIEARRIAEKAGAQSQVLNSSKRLTYLYHNFNVFEKYDELPSKTKSACESKRGCMACTTRLPCRSWTP